MRKLLIAAIAVIFAAASASASSIGVYFDAAATTCEASIPIHTQFTWYHCVRLFDDALENGFTAAEYRQTGTPDGWIVSAMPNPAIFINQGNPLAEGALVSFNACQTGVDGVVVLFTVTGFSTTEVTDAELHIEPHMFPGNPDTHCPNLINCSAPIFSRFCVAESPAVINRVHSTACLPLGVQPASWAGVKSLYQQ